MGREICNTVEHHIRYANSTVSYFLGDVLQMVYRNLSGLACKQDFLCQKTSEFWLAAAKIRI